MSASDGLFDLTGRTALVTGSTRGIGAAIAEAYARAGADVILHGRDPARVATARDELHARLRADGLAADLHAVGFDVTDHDAARAAVADLEQRLEGVDVLVNNAGTQFRAPVLDFSDDAWDDVLATNLTSCFVLAKAVAAGMIGRGHGKIINICSVQNKLVRNATIAYAAAKSALGTMGQVMCADWARHGLQINGLAPGYIDTELNQALRADERMDAWVGERTPAARWGTPDDLAGPAVWLASRASDFVNGQLIFVDGGMTAVL